MIQTDTKKREASPGGACNEKDMATRARTNELGRRHINAINNANYWGPAPIPKEPMLLENMLTPFLAQNVPYLLASDISRLLRNSERAIVQKKGAEIEYLQIYSQWADSPKTPMLLSHIELSDVGQRNKMEDAHFIREIKNQGIDGILAGVFDGHSGDCLSNIAAKRFFDTFLYNLNTHNSIIKVFEETIYEIDRIYNTARNAILKLRQIHDGIIIDLSDLSNFLLVMYKILDDVQVPICTTVYKSAHNGTLTLKELLNFSFAVSKRVLEWSTAGNAMSELKKILEIKDPDLSGLFIILNDIYPILPEKESQVWLRIYEAAENGNFLFNELNTLYEYVSKRYFAWSGDRNKVVELNEILNATNSDSMSICKYLEDMFFTISDASVINQWHTIYKKVEDGSLKLNELIKFYKSVEDLAHAGSTAVICFVDKINHLVITANVGDSGAKIMIPSEDETFLIPLSRPHHFGIEKEANRVIKMLENPPNEFPQYQRNPVLAMTEKNNFIKLRETVLASNNPLDVKTLRFPPNFLNMSRALGDEGISRGIIYKKKPNLTICPLKSGAKIVIASDGLWDTLTDQEILQSLKSNPEGDELITKAVVEGEDNVTIVLIDCK